MNVTRRQGLLAIVAALGGMVLEASFVARPRTRPAPRVDAEHGWHRPAPRKLSRTVEPAPHSVKRHA